MRNKLNQNGIGLVETIAALGVAVVVITSLVSLALFTLRSSINSKLFLEGTKMANEEIELVRAYRDSSGMTWSGTPGFISNMSSCFGGSAKCFIDASGNTLTVTASDEVFNTGTPTELKRFFRLSYPDTGNANLVRVEVEVSWSVGSIAKYSHNYTELANWKGN